MKKMQRRDEEKAEKRRSLTFRRDFRSIRNVTNRSPIRWKTVPTNLVFTQYTHIYINSLISNVCLPFSDSSPEAVLPSARPSPRPSARLSIPFSVGAAVRSSFYSSHHPSVRPFFRQSFSSGQPFVLLSIFLSPCPPIRLNILKDPETRLCRPTIPWAIKEISHLLYPMPV